MLVLISSIEGGIRIGFAISATPFEGQSVQTGQQAAE